MNRIRWARENAARDADEPKRLLQIRIDEIIGEGPVESGQYVGTLQWSDHTGHVRRWIFRRGFRSGQVLIDGLANPKTVTWVLDKLRRHLSSFFRCGLRG